MQYNAIKFYNVNVRKQITLFFRKIYGEKNYNLEYTNSHVR